MIDIHCNYRANCAFAWNVHFLARKQALCREMVALKMKHVSGFGVAAPEIGHTDLVSGCWFLVSGSGPLTNNQQLATNNRFTHS